MKKRLLVVLLLLSMLCTMVSCKNKEYGEFYTEDGILQNTSIFVVIETENLVAPLSELSYTLYEKCGFYVSVMPHAKGTKCQDLIEVYRDGKWQEAPTGGEGALDVPLSNNDPNQELDYTAHHTVERHMKFPEIMGEGQRGATLQYLPLEPGQYRLRVKYKVYAEDEDVEIPEGQLEAVAYFTVTAPAE